MSAKKIAISNKKLAFQNSLLEKRIALTERSIMNSLGGLSSGLLGANEGFMSPLTSFNPTLQNNQYAPITLMWTALMYVYKTHGIIQTAIDQPVLDAFRGGLELISDGQLSADDLKKIEDFMEEHNVLDRIVDAFIWARLFGGGALIINSDAPGADDGAPLGDEIMDGKMEFYDACRWELTCERRIPKSGKYGYYGKKLDSSRVMTILGKRAPWLIRAQLSDWGMSEYERMVESFNLYLRNRNVIYALLEEAKVDVYSLEGFTGQLASSTGTATTVRRIQTMNQIKNYNNALIMDKKDDYHQKQISFGGLAEMIKESRMEIAGDLRMPMSKLFGIPSTGFSSGEDDIENYNGMIESEVRTPARPVVKKVLGLVVKHLFGDDIPVDFKFRPLRILSAVDEEAVKTSKQNRYTALYDRMLMNSKEIGEAMQKDNLVPIPLEAEKGILEDHPVPDQTAVGLEEGGTEEPISEEGDVKQPSQKGGKVEKMKKQKEPEKPQKLNTNRQERR